MMSVSVSISGDGGLSISTLPKSPMKAENVLAGGVVSSTTSPVGALPENATARLTKCVAGIDMDKMPGELEKKFVTVKEEKETVATPTKADDMLTLTGGDALSTKSVVTTSGAASPENTSARLTKREAEIDINKMDTELEEKILALKKGKETVATPTKAENVLAGGDANASMATSEVASPESTSARLTKYVTGIDMDKMEAELEKKIATMKKEKETAAIANLKVVTFAETSPTKAEVKPQAKATVVGDTTEAKEQEAKVTNTEVKQEVPPEPLVPNVLVLEIKEVRPPNAVVVTKGEMDAIRSVDDALVKKRKGNVFNRMFRRIQCWGSRKERAMSIETEIGQNLVQNVDETDKKPMRDDVDDDDNVSVNEERPEVDQQAAQWDKDKDKDKEPLKNASTST